MSKVYNFALFHVMYVYMYTVLFYPLTCCDIINVMQCLPVFISFATLGSPFVPQLAHPRTMMEYGVFCSRPVKVCSVLVQPSTGSYLLPLSHDMRYLVAPSN